METNGLICIKLLIISGDRSTFLIILRRWWNIQKPLWGLYLYFWFFLLVFSFAQDRTDKIDNRLENYWRDLLSLKTRKLFLQGNHLEIFLDTMHVTYHVLLDTIHHICAQILKMVIAKTLLLRRFIRSSLF